MPIDVIDVQRLCLLEILVLACLALLFGAADLSRSGSERWNTVMAARFPREERRSRLPAPPRAIFFALMLAGFGVLKCRGFFGDQPVFVAGMIGGLLSAGFWLLVASGIQRSAEQERSAHIEAFMADPNAPVPPPVRGLDAPPPWLRIWNGANIVVFGLLIANVVRCLLALPSGR